MSDLTTDALVEAVARAIAQDDCWPESLRNECLAGGTCTCMNLARAALAAVAKAAGGADELFAAAPWLETPGTLDQVAALLRALAGAADGR